MRATDIPSFVDAAVTSVSAAAYNARRKLTRESRVLRRYSIQEIADLMDCDRTHLHNLLKHPDAPEGESQGRERTFSVHDIMKLRAISDSRPGARLTMLHWRKPGTSIPCIVVSSQKGGVGKSLTAAHLSQYLAISYGLRVGVIDADPQATCSQYFSGDETDIHGYNVETYTDFMGLPEPGVPERIPHDADRLNVMWRPTPWPGLRMIPGGARIQEADISLFFMARTRDPELRKVYRLLRDNLTRWSAAYPAKTQPADLLRSDGGFNDDLFRGALTETLDVIIIDTPPSLSLATLNTIVAADTLIVPQTMKGFDLSTLHAYLHSLRDYFDFIAADTNPIKWGLSRSMILPTIVNTSTDTDLLTIGELIGQNPDVVSKVFYKYNQGCANAFREFKSVYEYKPDRNRRESVQKFLENANAVNDMIVQNALPHLPGRGYARRFIEENYPEGVIQSWSGEPVAIRQEKAA